MIIRPEKAIKAFAPAQLLMDFGPVEEPVHLIMDKAYESNGTRQLAFNLGYIPVAPPKSNRLDPWKYDKAMYRMRN